VKKSIGLQALRGIAVALVIFFHLGFTQFRNGWIGVDIFFVLSGFLMWELYQQSILNGNVLEFYRRRLKRLLPALSILLIFSNFIFFFRFLPYERQLLVNEILAANIFASNINYWMGDQYFSNGSLRPLLNLWSIAVEIQFYLLFPLIVLVIKQSRFRFFLLFVASFLSFLTLSQMSPQTNFFLLPGRLWEFLLGMLVGAIVRLKAKYRPNFNFILFFSIAFLALSLSLPLDSFQTVAFQVITVSLFSLLIWAAWSGGDRNILTVCLSKLGDYSYSLYLIHFPLIALIAYQPFLGNPVGIHNFQSLFLFSFLLISLSWLSKCFVEDSDFLKKHFLNVWGVSLALSVTLLILQPTTIALGFNSKEVAVSNASKDRGEFRCGLLLRLPLLNDPSKTCLLADSLKDMPKVLLMGDSHANAIKEAVVSALPNRSVYLLNENNPVSALNIKTYKKAITDLRPKTVILHSSAGSTNFEALQNLLRFTKSKGVDFVVIDPVPTPGFDVPSTAYNLLSASKSLIDFKNPEFTIDNYKMGNAVELSFYSKLASAREIVQISVVDLFCKPFCQIVDSQSLKPFYFDYGHVTKTGAFKLVSRIEGALK
jgi:peptidoglycan/LPS O-acetylase OafA/YrhL